ncbi:MAG: DUF309 domain-containing protein [Desulfobacter sp.]|nr:DUF309 domain-containing protein [Desulfobacter sp.]
MFDPFEKRVSRDIRNQLCQSFLDALSQKDWTIVEKTACLLVKTAPDKDHIDFIHSRMTPYKLVFEKIFPVEADPLKTAWLLWDNALFFECHEWVEELWLKAGGRSKKALQAIIRTNGAHALDEAGRRQAAISSAQKAMALVKEFRAQLPSPFHPDELITSLTSLLAK